MKQKQFTFPPKSQRSWSGYFCLSDIRTRSLSVPLTSDPRIPSHNYFRVPLRLISSKKSEGHKGTCSWAAENKASKSNVQVITICSSLWLGTIATWDHNKLAGGGLASIITPDYFSHYKIRANIFIISMLSYQWCFVIHRSWCLDVHLCYFYLR